MQKRLNTEDYASNVENNATKKPDDFKQQEYNIVLKILNILQNLE